MGWSTLIEGMRILLLKLFKTKSIRNRYISYDVIERLVMTGIKRWGLHLGVIYEAFIGCAQMGMCIHQGAVTVEHQ